MTKFNKIIMNPPFYEEKPAGKKRASKHLDIQIWDKAIEMFPDAETISLMSHTCLNMKGHKYVSSEYIGKFPGAGIDCALFTYNKNGPFITEFRDKYEDNGMKPWIRENDISDTGKSLCNLIDRKTKFNKEEPILEGYVAFHERSGRKIHAWKEGELPLKSNGKLCETLCYVKTSDPEKMKSWIMNEVSEQYATFIDRFKSGHVDRGFSKTVEVPEDLRP